MAQYCVFKGEELLGPFSIGDLQEFVKSGLILKRDVAFCTDNPDFEETVDYFLKANRLSCNVEHKGSLSKQLKDIGKELILPQMTFTREPWQRDNKLFILSLVGVTMSVILAISEAFSPFMIFYSISLYFSLVWGMIFHYLFTTNQVKIKLTVLLFFATQLVIIISYNILHISEINPFYEFLNSNSPIVSLLSYILGVGLVEETVKLIPVLIILHFAKNVMKPQTMVYYGLMSGIAFGVFEGVNYQMNVNINILSEGSLTEGYAYSFLLNIARLTCLPFLHAIWCGIASYFASFAYLYPRYRKSLYLLAIIIPATLHGLYDFVCGISSLLTIPIILIAVILLMVYMNINYSFHSRLAD